MKTPILETERLILRPLTVTDADEVYTNWTSDPEVARFMVWSTHPNVEVTRTWLESCKPFLDSDTAYEWGFIRKNDGKIIGCGGLHYKESQNCFSLGYNTMKACWHQGYTTEAARAMLDFAIKELGCTRFYASHAKDNPNSGKVMEKVGFRYIQDNSYDSFDGSKHFESREYILDITDTQ